MPAVLAIDVGSSFAKVQRFDDSGAPVGDTHRAPTGLGAGGWADAEEVADTVDGLVDAALEDGGDFDAVALSSAWHTLVGVDGRGRPTTELSTWMDGRAGAEAVELRGTVADAADAHDRTGAPFHPSLPPARLLWLARHRPEKFAATARWCSLAELLATRWFGVPVGPSSSIASGSGLFDQWRRTWDGELLDLLSQNASALAPVD